MGDRRISPKRKGNVLSSYVIPAHMNALEAMALTEKQQGRYSFAKKERGKNNLGSY